MHRPPARLAVLALALAASVACVPACTRADDATDESTPRAPEIVDVDYAAAELESADAARVRTALLDVSRAADLPLRLNPERDRHRLLLGTAAVDIWLYARTAEVMARLSRDPELAARWQEEARIWGEIVDLVAVVPTLVAQQDATTTADRLAQRLRPMLRPLLRDEETRPTATATLRILDAAQFDEDAGRARLAQRLAVGPEEPGALQQNLLLALRAATALERLATDDPREHPLELALATTQVCPDAIAGLLDAESSDAVVDVLRRRCAFACTDGDLLGLTEPRTLAPVSPDDHATCRLPALRDDVPGPQLAVANFLATNALAELARLRDALRATVASPDERLARIVEPFVETFARRVDQALVVGDLPYVGPNAVGPSLPTRPGAVAAIDPAPAVAIAYHGELRLAAWPRYRLEGDAVVDPAAIAGHGWPGQVVADLDATPDAATIAAAIAEIDALPWPSAERPDDPRAVRSMPLVVDRDATAGELRAAAAWLAAAGVARVDLVAWPGPDAVYTTPAPTAVSLRIDRPPPRTPILRLADEDTHLVDTLGRADELPIFSVERFLPDVYAAVHRYLAAHPAITELVLDPDPDLPARTLLLAVVALEHRRVGEIMASTEHLFAAERMEGPRGPIPLVRTLYLAPQR